MFFSIKEIWFAVRMFRALRQDVQLENVYSVITQPPPFTKADMKFTLTSMTSTRYIIFLKFVSPHFYKSVHLLSKNFCNSAYIF
jgi:hypothetical protein